MSKGMLDNQLLKEILIQTLWEIIPLIMEKLKVMRVITWTHKTRVAMKIQAMGQMQMMLKGINPKIIIMSPKSRLKISTWT